MLTCSRLITAWFALALVLLATSVRAQDVADTATARSLAVEGHKAMKQGDCAMAADRFRRAEELHHAITLLLGGARANVCLGKLLEAQELYNRIIREPLGARAAFAFIKAQKDAEREVAALRDRIAWVTIEVAGADEPHVTLNGKKLRAATLGVRRAINPGKHIVKASATGFWPAERTFTLAEGGSDKVSLTLTAVPTEPKEAAADEPPIDELPVAETPIAPEPKPDDAAPSSSQRTVGFVSFGIAGAGLVVGGVMAGLAADRHAELLENCSDHHCPKDQEGTMNQFGAFATTSTAGFIAAGAFAATGLILVLTAPNDNEGETASTASLRVDPRAVTFKLAF